MVYLWRYPSPMPRVFLHRMRTIRRYSNRKLFDVHHLQLVAVRRDVKTIEVLAKQARE